MIEYDRRKTYTKVKIHHCAYMIEEKPTQKLEIIFNSVGEVEREK